MEAKGAACVIVLISSIGVEAIHPHHWPPYPHLPESGHSVPIGGPGTAAVSSNGTVNPQAIYTAVGPR